LSGTLETFFHWRLGIRLIDRMQYKGNIAIKIPWSYEGLDYVDIDQVIISLGNQGIDLVEDTTEIDQLIIRDRIASDN
ncbi:MAG: hypothetical protein J7497_13975, partial [Chitinophagaceae bacterium]|nr:hypothetical protein [Chitinophagaceae bacterium]